MDMLFIAGLWGIGLTIVNPAGNFPLNDDWSFGLAVKYFLQSGDFRPTGWTSMPLLSNVLWGSLFCLPTGFSFIALRISTLVLALTGILICYFLIRELSQPRWLAVVASMTLAFNPVYLTLSNTFMTDVPFTAVSLLAALFFARNLKTDCNRHLIFGTALAVVGTLSRQLALCVPLAFAVVSLFRKGFGMRNLLRACLPSALCIVVLLVFQQWLSATGRLPAQYNAATQNLLVDVTHPLTLARTIADNSYVTLLYLGLFLLPILLALLPKIWRTNKEQMIALLAFAIVPVAEGGWVRSTYLGKNAIMPLLPSRTGNIFIESGIGPLTLLDTFVYKLNHVAALPRSFWIAVTAMSMIGASLLVATLGVSIVKMTKRLGTASRINDNETVGVFFLLCVFVYFLPLIGYTVFDRYLIAVLPLLLAGIAGISGQLSSPATLRSRIPGLAASVLCTAYLLFAVCGTRDYLSWNRLRWEAIDDLLADKRIQVQDIDGGFEFNGLYMYDPSQKDFWWAQKSTYLIAFGNLPGYTTIKEYNFSHWLPPYEAKLVVLRKTW